MKQRKYALDEIILLKLKDTVFLVCMSWVGIGISLAEWFVKVTHITS